MTVFQFITFLLIGLGLSFDSFAVSVSVGLLRRDIRFFQACKIAFSLAFFQGIFPVIGWMIGNVIEELISTIDH